MYQANTATIRTSKCVHRC